MKLDSKTEAQRILLKFGGTSLADGEKIRNLAQATAHQLEKGKQIAVVVSAMGKTTDILTEHFLEACQKKDALREMDDVLSMGERTSARLFTAALKACSVDSRYFDPSDPDWPIITDDHFGNAKPVIEECIQRIKSVVLPLLQKSTVPVIPGFIGRTLKGEVTTLGRGGSDTTTFIMARAIEAKEVTLVTDVDGIMTGDPKIVSNPKRIERIDAAKLVCLCDSDVKFIRRKALKFLDGSFRLRIVGNHRSEFDSGGTVVTGWLQKVSIDLECNAPVCAIMVAGQSLSNSLGILAKIFREVDRRGVAILSQSIDSDAICIYLPEERANEIAEAIHSVIVEDEKELAIALKRNLAFLRIVGIESESIPIVLKRIMESFEEGGIDIIGTHVIGSNLLVFVNWNERDAALFAIKKIYEAL